MRNSESCRMNGDTVWSMSASSGLMNQFSTVAPFLSDPGFQFLPLGCEPCVKSGFLDGRCVTVERPHPSRKTGRRLSIVAFFDASDFAPSWRRWVRRDWSRFNPSMYERTPAFNINEGLIRGLCPRYTLLSVLLCHLPPTARLSKTQGSVTRLKRLPGGKAC
jgi:hypothetical protein